MITSLDTFPDEVLIMIFNFILPNLEFNKTVRLVDFQNIWNDPKKTVIKILLNLLTSSKKIRNVLLSNEYNIWKKLYNYHFGCFKVINSLSNTSTISANNWFKSNHKMLGNNVYVNSKPFWTECGYKLFAKFFKYGIENNFLSIIEEKFGDVLNKVNLVNYINYQNIINDYQLLKTNQCILLMIKKYLGIHIH